MIFLKISIYNNVHKFAAKLSNAFFLGRHVIFRTNAKFALNASCLVCDTS